MSLFFLPKSAAFGLHSLNRVLVKEHCSPCLAVGKSLVKFAEKFFAAMMFAKHLQRLLQYLIGRGVSPARHLLFDKYLQF